MIFLRIKRFIAAADILHFYRADQPTSTIRYIHPRYFFCSKSRLPIGANLRISFQSGGETLCRVLSLPKRLLRYPQVVVDLRVSWVDLERPRKDVNRLL